MYETVSYNNEVNKSSTVDLRTIKVKSLACKQNAITPFQIQTDSELSIWDYSSDYNGLFNTL